MAQLAQSCGTSKAGLYHYYASKEALLFDALDRYTRRLLAAAQAVQAQALAPREGVARLLRQFVAEYRDANAYHVALLHDVHRLAPQQRDAIRAQERAVVAVFHQMLAAAWPERLAGRTAMPTTMALLGMINFSFAWLRPDGPLSHEEFAELVIRLWQGALDAAPLPAAASAPAVSAAC